MIALLSTLALSLTASLAPAVQDNEDEGLPPIQDLGDTYLLSFSENTDGLTLERWVKLCQQTTGINFTYSNDTMGNLSSKLELQSFRLKFEISS